MDACRLVCLGLLLLLANCGPRKVAVTAPPSPPEHVLQYRAGVAAFQEATPEGYLRAIAAFRRASMLEPAECRYSLHLAESLMFLALERKLNWEDFAAQGAEAIAIIDSSEQSPLCVAHESFLRRVRAVSWSQEYRSPGPAAASIQFQVRQVAGNDPVAMINRAIELDPRDPMNWLALWKINATDSRAPLLRAQELAADLPLVQYELGNFQLTVGKYPEAKRSFERALELNPRHFRSLIGVAYTLGAVDPDADAGPLFQKAVGIAPGYLEARMLLGSYYAALEETEKAIEEYQSATVSNAKYDPAYLAWGVTLMRGGLFADAEKQFLKVLELHPTGFEAPYYLGNIEMGRNELAKAKARYQQSLSYRLNFPEAVYGLGNVLYREGNPAEALAQYDRAVRMNQDFADAYVSRGAIRAERQEFPIALGDYDRAIEIYRKQITKLGGDAQKSESLGWLRKAAAERRERARIENQLQQVEEFKKRAGWN